MNLSDVRRQAIVWREWARKGWHAQDYVQQSLAACIAGDLPRAVASVNRAEKLIAALELPDQLAALRQWQTQVQRLRQLDDSWRGDRQEAAIAFERGNLMRAERLALQASQQSGVLRERLGPICILGQELLVEYEVPPAVQDELRQLRIGIATAIRERRVALLDEIWNLLARLEFDRAADLMEQVERLDGALSEEETVPAAIEPATEPADPFHERLWTGFLRRVLETGRERLSTAQSKAPEPDASRDAILSARRAQVELLPPDLPPEERWLRAQAALQAMEHLAYARAALDAGRLEEAEEISRDIDLAPTRLPEWPGLNELVDLLRAQFAEVQRQAQESRRARQVSVDQIEATIAVCEMPNANLAALQDRLEAASRLIAASGDDIIRSYSTRINTLLNEVQQQIESRYRQQAREIAERLLGDLLTATPTRGEAARRLAIQVMEAARLDPDREAALIDALIACARRLAPAPAREMLQAAIESRPDRSELMAWRGWAEAQLALEGAHHERSPVLDDEAHVIARLEQAVNYQPQDPVPDEAAVEIQSRALIALLRRLTEQARRLAATGDFAGALTAEQRVMNTIDTHPQAAARLGPSVRHALQRHLEQHGTAQRRRDEAQAAMEQARADIDQLPLALQSIDLAIRNRDPLFLDSDAALATLADGVAALDHSRNRQLNRARGKRGLENARLLIQQLQRLIEPITSLTGGPGRDAYISWFDHSRLALARKIAGHLASEEMTGRIGLGPDVLCWRQAIDLLMGAQAIFPDDRFAARIDRLQEAIAGWQQAETIAEEAYRAIVRGDFTVALPLLVQANQVESDLPARHLIDPVRKIVDYRPPATSPGHGPEALLWAERMVRDCANLFQPWPFPRSAAIAAGQDGAASPVEGKRKEAQPYSLEIAARIVQAELDGRVEQARHVLGRQADAWLSQLSQAAPGTPEAARELAFRVLIATRLDPQRLAEAVNTLVVTAQRIPAGPARELLQAAVEQVPDNGSLLAWRSWTEARLALEGDGPGTGLEGENGAQADARLERVLAFRSQPPVPEEAMVELRARALPILMQRLRLRARQLADTGDFAGAIEQCNRALAAVHSVPDAAARCDPSLRQALERDRDHAMASQELQAKAWTAIELAQADPGRLGVAVEAIRLAAEAGDPLFREAAVPLNLLIEAGQALARPPTADALASVRHLIDYQQRLAQPFAALQTGTGHDAFAAWLEYMRLNLLNRLQTTAQAYTRLAETDFAAAHELFEQATRYMPSLPIYARLAHLAEVMSDRQGLARELDAAIRRLSLDSGGSHPADVLERAGYITNLARQTLHFSEDPTLECVLRQASESVEDDFAALRGRLQRLLIRLADASPDPAVASQLRTLERSIDYAQVSRRAQVDLEPSHGSNGYKSLAVEEHGAGASPALPLSGDPAFASGE